MPVSIADSKCRIDCGAFPKTPFTPMEWKVVFHQEIKDFLDLRKIVLIPAHKVWSEMFEMCESYEIDGKKYLPLNACLLDFFRENPERFPQEWKEKNGNHVKHIFFAGTGYSKKSPSKKQKPDYFVRYLFFEGGVPGWFCRSRDGSPEDNQYVALLEV